MNLRITACPCCGGRVDTDLPLVDLDSNAIAYGERVVRVQPRSAELMDVLVDRYPRVAEMDFLLDRVWGRNNVDARRGSISVHVMFLRKAISEMPWKIRNHHNHGYSLKRA